MLSTFGLSALSVECRVLPKPSILKGDGALRKYSARSTPASTARPVLTGSADTPVRIPKRGFDFLGKARAMTLFSLDYADIDFEVVPLDGLFWPRLWRGSILRGAMPIFNSGKMEVVC